MLNDMYNHLDDNAAIKIFIKKNCSHLLFPPAGNTGYPTNYFKNLKFISFIGILLGNGNNVYFLTVRYKKKYY